MDEDIKDCIRKTLNSDLPAMVEGYIDNRAYLIKNDIAKGKQPETIIRLIHTLKYWANPSGSYQACLPNEDYIQFKKLITLVKDPQSLQPQVYLEAKRKNTIRVAVQNRLNQIADELIIHYQLTNVSQANTTVPWSTWWQQKTSFEQERIKHTYNRLNAEDKTFLLKQANRSHIGETYLNDMQHPAWYYLMCQYYCCLPHHQIAAFLTPTPALFTVPRATWPFATYGKTIGSAYPPGTHGGTGDGVLRGFNLVAASVAGLGLIAAGLLGAVYAAKKAFSSVKNLFAGSKMLRSLCRLVGIGAGAYGGAYLGVPIGIVLASMIPGIPPGIGAMIGSVATASLFAGVGAVITKYVAKATSYYFNSFALNPTNPTKYELTPDQKNNIAQQGLSLQTVEDMIKTIHREKKQLGLASAFFWTPAYRKRKDLNQLLSTVKNNPQNLDYPLSIGLLAFDARRQYFDPTIPTYSSTADYLSPYFGYTQPQANDRFAPTAPPAHEATPITPPMNPEFNHAAYMNPRFGR